MDEDRFTGAAREAAGKMQGAAGSLMGNDRMQARGEANEVQGQVENALGQLADSIRNQPLTSVLVGAGIGWILGRLRII